MSLPKISCGKLYAWLPYNRPGIYHKNYSPDSLLLTGSPGFILEGIHYSNSQRALTIPTLGYQLGGIKCLERNGFIYSTRWSKPKPIRAVGTVCAPFWEAKAPAWRI